MDNAARRAVEAMLKPIGQRVAMAVARAVVKFVKDTESRQTLQAEILDGELRNEIERAQNYGFTSTPHPGCDAIIVCVAGSRDQAVAVVVDDRRYRLKALQPGEVALYDDLGNKIMLLRDMIKVEAVQHLEATAPTTRIVSDVTIEGSLTVEGPTTLNGDVATTGALTNDGKDVGDSHRHLASGGPGVGGVPQ